MDAHDPARFLNGSKPGPPAIDLRRIVEYNEYICTVFGFFLNFLLCYLIVFKTSSRLHAYKPVLLQNCLLDVFYNFANAITHAQVEFKQGNFFVLMNGPFAYTPYPWNGLLVGLWVFGLFFCVTGIPIQFYLRYSIVVKEHKLSKKEHAFLLLVAAGLALSYTVVWTATNWPYPDKIAAKSYLIAADKYYFDGVPSFLTAGIWELEFQLVFTYCYVLVAGSYAIIIYTSVKVYRHFGSSGHLPAELLDAQRQLTLTLMVQAVAPVIVCLMPIVICVTGCFLYVDIPGLGLLCTLLFSWIPLVNSAIAIAAIKTYRQTVLKFLKLFTLSNKVYSASPTGLSGHRSTVKISGSRVTSAAEPSVNRASQAAP